MFFFILYYFIIISYTISLEITSDKIREVKIMSYNHHYQDLETDGFLTTTGSLSACMSLIHERLIRLAGESDRQEYISDPP